MTIENPVDTVIRLLNTYLHVQTDEGGLAKVLVSSAWYDRKLFKDYHGQVTVSLSREEGNKLTLDGSLWRRFCFVKADVWVLDNPTENISGKSMRFKICEDILRVIKEKHNTPHITNYDLNGLGTPSTSHKAYHAESDTELSPSDGAWTELTNAEYVKLWDSDDDRFSKTVVTEAKYPMMLFRFKVSLDVDLLKKIVLNFEGYGTAGAGNGTTIKVWNKTASAWQNSQTGTGGADENIQISLTSDFTDYVDDNGFIYLLARTTNPAAEIEAVLFADYSSCQFEIYGITHIDRESRRDLDMVEEKKPFLFHTEFMLKSWFIETISEG